VGVNKGHLSHNSSFGATLTFPAYFRDCQLCNDAMIMPRDGAIVFSDLIGKLDVLRVSCTKCERDGCYGLSRLIDKRGRDAKVIDWLDQMTADCPTKRARNMSVQCGARCPDLPKVL
jgi:hypothetical protein